MDDALGETWTRGAFINWLVSQHPGYIAGIRKDPCHCPISNWRLNVFGEVWTINMPTMKKYFGDGETMTYTTPDWTQDFIRAVDNHNALGVTFGSCLDLLKSLEERNAS